MDIKKGRYSLCCKGGLEGQERKGRVRRNGRREGRDKGKENQTVNDGVAHSKI